MAQLRSIAVYYKEFSSIENLLVPGENYIREQKSDFPSGTSVNTTDITERKRWSIITIQLP
ncbi:MAG: hypothetical protein LBP72_10470 [Dysgonamonadaceae bacterium]|nr:hypothetical protein [Dysgonamonadaceae bacterium]